MIETAQKTTPKHRHERDRVALPRESGSGRSMPRRLDAARVAPKL